LLKRQHVSVAALVLLLLGAIGPESAQAGLIFNVGVDTSSLNGQTGFLDFQFNPGDSSALSATSTVSLFQTNGGVLAQPASLTGDATGSLPGTLTLDNGSVYNDIFQGFTFGNSFTFDLALSGPAVSSSGGTVGSAFAVSLYAADGFTPLLTTDPNASVATIDLNPNGTASVYTFAQSSTDNTAAATVSSASAVPEPSTLAMLLLVASLQAGWMLFRSARRRLSAGNITCSPRPGVFQISPTSPDDSPAP
jgi:hypothetical protein